jgi:tyrosinase
MAKYIVHTGDTFSAIAARFGVSLATLVGANPQITDPNRIFPGQVVTIPGSSPAAGSDYVVQSGDTLNAIANRFGVSLAALKAANPQISDPNRIFPGQIITIPGSSPAVGPAYVVQSGDTLTAIANRFGVSLATLKAANPQITDPNRIFPGQIITTLAVFVRHDIWTLDQQNHWHPTIYAYARGISVMQQRAATDPTSWDYQAAVHGTDPDPLDGFRNQCQHFSWFFGSWHRMYLYWFEQMIRAAIQNLPDIDDETKRTWALPYWNYSNPDENDNSRRKLPKAFLDVTLPDGITPNPLRDPTRSINDGSAMRPEVVRLAQALAPVTFAGPGGFAGGKTGFNHFFEDPNAAGGPLEQTPHGAVHVQVGGNMGLFEFAALDPIFWLHHANIDRLWDVWLRQPGRANSTEAAWLTGVSFKFHDENAVPQTQQSKDVTDQQLDYVYEDISVPGPDQEAAVVEPEQPAFPPELVGATEEPVGPTGNPERPAFPPELVGATEEPVALTGDTVTISFGISPPEGPLAEADAAPSLVLLDLADITSSDIPGVTYGVYVNVPDGDPATDDEHYVGNAAFFGIETLGRPDSEHAGMRLIYDITDLYNRLNAAGQWSDQVSVTFVAQYLERPAEPIELPADESVPAQQPGNVRVGRVSIFLQ